jgi:hypothetical protein
MLKSGYTLVTSNQNRAARAPNLGGKARAWRERAGGSLREPATTMAAKGVLDRRKAHKNLHQMTRRRGSRR